VDLAP